MHRASLLALTLFLAPLALAQNDDAYSKRIKEVTTEPYFLTELVDHLPASTTVPSPLKHFGKIVGEPEVLHYTDEINGYMRALDAASDRVLVRSMGKSEEGREMIAVFISDAANLARLDEMKQLNQRLSDPRALAANYKGDGKLDGADAQAEQIIQKTVPIYYATGGMHSPESGPPEMLMELAYRLAVEESPMIQEIRKNSVVMVTPVLDTDGRDRYVDTYYYRKRNPKKPPVPLLYWGKYVAHDNNRDNIGMQLALSKNLMRTWLEYRPIVMHDLHQSVPFLYISTGTGPYNAWLDPITIDEWHLMAYKEVSEMTKRGVPGVWTHGFYDGWAPNYAFYAANGHNAIGRFYETFGSDADTRVANVGGDSTTREWFRPNPPLSKVRWSIRNNINLSQSALLMGLSGVAHDKDTYLRNYYQKAKRSVMKPWTEGPAAYVLPKDEEKPLLQYRLASLLETQGVETQALEEDVETKDGKLKKGSLVVRMDQPYCRMADMLLDKQYYKSTDPEPYDDTGWTLGPLFNLQTIRAKDSKILSAKMGPLPRGTTVIPVSKTDSYLIIRASADPFLTNGAWRVEGVEVAEAPFKVGKTEFPAGSYILSPALSHHDRLMDLYANRSSSQLTWSSEKPKVKTHLLTKPRIALVHDWVSTQDEGWVRLALDELDLPYKYVSVHELRDNSRLKGSYDVIIFGPSFNPDAIVEGRSTLGDPIPWKPMEGLKHLGGPDTSDDIRGGAGLQGMLHLKSFLDEGGLLICMGPTAQLPVTYGFVKGVTLSRTQGGPAGGVFMTERADKVNPVLYGYGDNLSAYTNGDYWPFRATISTGTRGFGGGQGSRNRASGRGDLNDPDVVQGRPQYDPPKDDPDTGYKAPTPPQPKVLLRFAPADKVLISGGYGSLEPLGGAPAVILAPSGKGQVLMLGINPMWRGETLGSWQLVTNAIANWNNLYIDEPKEEKKK